MLFPLGPIRRTIYTHELLMGRKPQEEKPRRRRKTEEEDDDPARREVTAVILLALAALFALSYFGLAGTAGRYIDSGLTFVFGTVRSLLFVLLTAVGFSVLFRGLRTTNVIGMVLFLGVASGFTHITNVPETERGVITAAMMPGGYAGAYAALPLYQFFGYYASILLLAAIFFIAISLLVPAPLSRLVSSSLWIARVMGMIVGVVSRFVNWLRSMFAAPAEDSSNTIGTSAAPTFAMHRIEVAPPIGTPDDEDEDESDEEGSEPSVVRKPRKAPLPAIEIPVSLLDKNTTKAAAGDIRTRSAIIQKTLENFGIEVEMGEVSVGPTVAQYTLRPAEGVKVASIAALSNDLALALAASAIRIEAPIPGKSLVGIEVPNEQVSMVKMRDILEHDTWTRRGSNLSMALGKDVAGKPWVADLARMPHLLVAGSTGSGKSVCLNTIIMSLLYANGPADLRFILVDPKRVELPIYNNIPHLLSPVITDVKRTVEALRWAINEMDRRYKVLQEAGSRDIKTYNERLRPGEERMPYVVFIVDELADLMVSAASSVEPYIIRLAQMARAVGIHLILATQRPSVDVLTGLIKANIPARIAFAVASLVDSRTILDSPGAEKLLGRGDMLFTTPEFGKARRIQGAFISDTEIKKVCDFLKAAGEPEYTDLSAKPEGAMGSAGGSMDDDEDSDPMLAEAKQVIMQAGKASASLLQRRLKVGYARAARILDLLEAQGFIGPADGAKPREILHQGEPGDTIE